MTLVRRSRVATSSSSTDPRTVRQRSPKSTAHKCSVSPRGVQHRHSCTHFRASTRPIVVTVDADDTYPAAIYPELVQRIRGGRRRGGHQSAGRRPPEAMPFRNWVANVLFSFWQVSTHTAFCATCIQGSERTVGRFFDRFDWDTTGRAFPVDLLLWPAIAGCRISEVDIPYRERIGETTLHRWTDGRGTLCRLFRRVKPRIH